MWSEQTEAYVGSGACCTSQNRWTRLESNSSSWAQTHCIISAFLSALPCPRFTQHTLHFTHILWAKGEKRDKVNIPIKRNKQFHLWLTSYQFPGFLLQSFVRTLHFLCSWVSCKAILAHHCSGPSRVIHYSAMPTAPFQVFQLWQLVEEAHSQKFHPGCFLQCMFLLQISDFLLSMCPHAYSFPSKPHKRKTTLKSTSLY